MTAGPGQGPQQQSFQPRDKETYATPTDSDAEQVRFAATQRNDDLGGATSSNTDTWVPTSSLQREKRAVVDDYAKKEHPNVPPSSALVQR